MTEYLYRVHVPWEEQEVIWWDEICVWAIEHFGLPGDKYITALTENYMDFVFADQRDAFIMRVAWGLVQ